MSKEHRPFDICGECGKSSAASTFDSFFKTIAFLCEACGNSWTRPLTPAERWAVLHGE